MKKKKKTNEKKENTSKIDNINLDMKNELNKEEVVEAEDVENMEQADFEIKNIEKFDNIDEEENKVKKENKKKKKKKKGKIKKFLLVILCLLLVGLIVYGSLFFVKVQKNGGGLQGFLATVVGHDENTLKKLPKMNVLITGQSQNLTDTIMVCSYDPKTQEASILSIPRDTFIGINKKRATSYDKINALYQLDPKKTLDAVNEITGLDIKYHINIDTAALRKVVDSIGGVYFDVPIDMDYEDCTQDLYIHLNKGYQLLDGDKAEQVVRFRHNSNGSSYSIEYGDNDLGRMKTQRNFIKAVILKLAKPSSLAKINDLIKIAEENVTTNIEDFSFLKDYAPYAVKFNVDNMKTETLPGTPELCNNIWIYTYDKAKTKEMVEELFGSDEEAEEDDDDDSEEGKSSNTIKNQTTNNGKNTKKLTEQQKQENKKIKIEILNGTSDTEKLSDVKLSLKEQGYTIVKTGITTNTSKTMIINRNKVKNEKIEAIKDVLKDLGIVQSGNENSDVDITIVIGKDMISKEKE